jgi:hypothetical protein
LAARKALTIAREFTAAHGRGKKDLLKGMLLLEAAKEDQARAARELDAANKKVLALSKYSCPRCYFLTYLPTFEDGNADGCRDMAYTATEILEQLAEDGRLDLHSLGLNESFDFEEDEDEDEEQSSPESLRADEEIIVYADGSKHQLCFYDADGIPELGGIEEEVGLDVENIELPRCLVCGEECCLSCEACCARCSLIADREDGGDEDVEESKIVTIGGVQVDLEEVAAVAYAKCSTGDVLRSHFSVNTELYPDAERELDAAFFQFWDSYPYFGKREQPPTETDRVERKAKFAAASRDWREKDSVRRQRAARNAAR